MNQAQQLADYMANGYKATRLTAQHQLGIANLTAVVSDLRLMGINVAMQRKQDSRGARYAEYKIPPETMRVLREKKRVVKTLSGKYHVIL